MSLKVVYLYMSLGSAPHSENSNWDPNIPCADKYTDGMKSEGTFLMLSELKRTGVVDDVMVFYESNRGPGFANWGRGIVGYVCPSIKWVYQFVKPDTIIYVRGGFRGWHEFLTFHKNKNWLMCYNANTGRERWTFWDIILWDLNSRTEIDRHGRLWYYYKKPIDESIFYPMEQTNFYDVCIGASHIHDKKGQWRAIDALIAYKEKYGKNLKAILPGYGNRGTQTSQIMTKIHDHGLNVTITGMLSREHLNATVFNRSKIGMFLGTHGQGDRGPLEALSSGLPLIIGSRRYHSPTVCDEKISLIPNDVNDINEIVELTHRLLSKTPTRKFVSSFFRENQGFKEACYPNIRFVFDFMRDNPKPTLEAKKEFLRIWNQNDKNIKSIGTSSSN